MNNTNDAAADLARLEGLLADFETASVAWGFKPDERNSEAFDNAMARFENAMYNALPALFAAAKERDRLREQLRDATTRAANVGDTATRFREEAERLRAEVERPKWALKPHADHEHRIVCAALGGGAGEVVSKGSRPDRCPRCTSPQPQLHPAMQHEGEVQSCTHPWHNVAAGRGEGRVE